MALLAEARVDRPPDPRAPGRRRRGARRGGVVAVPGAARAGAAEDGRARRAARPRAAQHPGAGAAVRAVAAYRRQPVPHSYAVLAAELAAAVEVVADELDADRMAVAAQPALLAVGMATGEVERTDDLSAEVVLAQIRSVVADLLLLTGMDPLEATDALPAGEAR